MEMFYQGLLVNFATFNLIYVFSETLLPNKNIVYISYIYGLFHAIYVSLMSIIYLSFYYFSTLSEDFHNYYMSISLAYFLFDLVTILGKKELYKAMSTKLINHHIIIIIFLFLAKDTYSYYIARGLLCEIPTIFVDIIWLCHHSNITPQKSLALLCVYSFAIFRVVNFAEMLLYALYIHQWMYAAMMCYILYINIYWLKKIIHKILINYNGRSSDS